MHLAVLFVLLSAQTPAEEIWVGGRLEYLPAGLELTLPDEWKAKVPPGEREGPLEADELKTLPPLEVLPPSEDLHLFIFSSPAQVFGRMKESIEEEVSLVITHPEVGAVGSPEDVNELMHLTAEGYGFYQGDVVDWRARIVNGGRETLFIVMVGNVDEHRAGLSRIFQSIQTVPIEIEDEEEGAEEEGPDMADAP